MFVLKKIVGTVLLPLTLSVALMVAGVAFLFIRRERAGRILAASGMLVLIVFSFRTVPYLLLKPLESAYKPCAVDSSAALPAVKWIVVLGGGHNANQLLPSSNRISAISLTRLVEGIRLEKRIPGAKLVLSGGDSFGGETDADLMAELARVLGVEPGSIVVERGSLDTEDQADSIRSIVKRDPFALVTSAWHMPRAMMVFRNAGTDPIPAPTDYLIKNAPVTVRNFYPTIEGLEESGTALREYLAMGWARLRGMK